MIYLVVKYPRNHLVEGDCSDCNLDSEFTDIMILIHNFF